MMGMLVALNQISNIWARASPPNIETNFEGLLGLRWSHNSDIITHAYAITACAKFFSSGNKLVLFSATTSRQNIL
jgi:hypothetical protein